MNADLLAALLILAAAPAATLHPVLYAFRQPWHKTLIGWGLLIYLIGMGLLIDISILYHWLGDDYPGRDVVRLTVYGLIVGGSWLSFIAYLRTPRDR